METRFGPEFFAGNRQKLVKLFAGTAPIVLTANGLVQSSSDSTFPLRQDRDFWYVTGIDEPDVILVIDKSKTYLILSEDHDHRIRFDGAQTAEVIAKTSGITDVLDYRAGWQRLTSRLKKVKHIATLAALPAYVQFYGFYANPAKSTVIDRVKSINSDIELLDLKQHLIQMRIIKQAVEIEAIQQAINVTEQTLKWFVRKTWDLDTTERQIENELYYQFNKNAADGLAFDSVVSSTHNTTAIHHTPDNTRLQKNGLLLLDVGAEVGHYASDLSRLYIAGKPSRRLMKIYQAVEEALDQALNLLKPGKNHREYENEMEKVVGEKLRELGLIKTIDRESVRRYFPTYTSHQLGLDAHDVPAYDRSLETGMVLAVEPGIYIPEEGIGMRIEENVAITKNGIKLMSTLPRGLQQLTIK